MTGSHCGLVIVFTKQSFWTQWVYHNRQPCNRAFLAPSVLLAIQK
jgi:hypothetical protein